MILCFRGREAGWEPLWESQRRCRNSKALLFWKLEDQCPSGQAERLHLSQVAPWPQGTRATVESTVVLSVLHCLQFALCYDVVVCSIIKRCSAQALKGTLGFPLIRFEDAIINMYPYTRVHPYETQEMIISDILKHFKEVINILHSELGLHFIFSYCTLWYKRLHHHSVISSALGLVSSFCLFVGAYQSGGSDPGLSGLPGQPHGLTERRHWGYEWTHQVRQRWRAHPQCYTWCFQLSCQGKKISHSYCWLHQSFSQCMIPDHLSISQGYLKYSQIYDIW